MPREPVATAPRRARRTFGRPRHRGIVMVELVLMLPIALVLIMATAELGRVLTQYNALNKAVRDGARHLASTALLGSTGVVQLDATTSNETRNLVVYGNILGAGQPRLEGLNTAQVTLATAAGGSASITVNYTYVPIFVRIPMPNDQQDLRPSFALRASMVTRAL